MESIRQHLYPFSRLILPLQKFILKMWQSGTFLRKKEETMLGHREADTTSIVGGSALAEPPSGQLVKLSITNGLSGKVALEQRFSQSWGT